MSLADQFAAQAGADAQAPGGAIADQFAAQLAQSPADAPRRPLQAPEKTRSLWDRMTTGGIPWSSGELIDRLSGGGVGANVPTGLANNPIVNQVPGIVQGAADPIVGTAQLAANVLPNSTGIPTAFNKAISSQEQKYQENRPSDSGFNVKIFGKDVNIDPARLAGNAMSPANLALALRMAPAATAGARAVQGGEMGFIGGATAPVQVGDKEKFWGPKTVQAGAGTIGGAILAPVMGFIGDQVGKLIARANFNPSKAASQTDEIIGKALSDAGQKASDVPPAQLAAVRTEVVDALSKGRQLDAAALMRMKDFDAAGIQATQGWITRGPRQFADENTMRAMSQPLTDVMAEGNQAVTRAISQYGRDSTNAPTASQNLATALMNFDKTKQQAVTAAYPKGQVGGDVPIQGLAQDVTNFVGGLPKSVRDALPISALEEYGLSGGKQLKPFTYDSAETLLQTLNASKNNDPAVGRALSKLNGFVKDAVAQGGDAGPYAAGRSLAAERFALHDQIPALKEAVESGGNVADNFAQKYVINAKSTPEVHRLAGLLKENAPDVFEQTKQQLGAELTRSAFGENKAGDKIVGQEAFNKALRVYEPKLAAFFSPAELDNLKLHGRIAAYQQAIPAASATNFSNTAGMLANLVRTAAPWVPVVKGTVQTFGEKAGGMAAIRPEVPSGVALTDAQRRAMAYILSGSAGAGGLGLASGIKGQ